MTTPPKMTMAPKPIALLAAAAVAIGIVAWLLMAVVPRWTGRVEKSGGASTALAGALASPTPAGPRIKARLFYVSDDGTKLVSVERDVPFAEGTVEQAKAIINAQLAPVADPLLSAMPPGTTLRAVFITENGDAYVDLSDEASSAHPGGSLNELLTVYTIVDVLTANLPAVAAVQILVGGREVDTLAGHVDLRRPLARDLSWVQ